MSVITLRAELEIVLWIFLPSRLPDGGRLRATGVVICLRGGGWLRTLLSRNDPSAYWDTQWVLTGLTHIVTGYTAVSVDWHC